MAGQGVGGGQAIANYSPTGLLPSEHSRFPPPAYLSFLFWTPLTIGMVYLLCTWWVVQWWCLAHSIFFTVVAFTTDGLQHFEIWLHRQEQARLRKLR